MRALHLLAIVAVALFAAGAPGCRKPPPGPSTGMPALPPTAPVHVTATGGGAVVHVWAEPTLAVALEQLKPELEARGAIKLELEYRDSTLVLPDLSRGNLAVAPDAFIYPDLGLFAKLIANKTADEVSLRTIGGDRLAVACRQGERWISAELFDIYRLRFKWLGLAPKDSILGQLSLQALTSDGVIKRVEPRLRYLSAATEMDKALKRDEVQLVMTYASTVAQQKDLGVAVLVNPDLHQDIRYKAIAASKQAAAPGVTALLRLLGEDTAVQQQLSGLGFVDRATALQEIK
jgi:ABC-type molybdate transport system substrate-binding protein